MCILIGYHFFPLRKQENLSWVFCGRLALGGVARRQLLQDGVLSRKRRLGLEEGGSGDDEQVYRVLSPCENGT